MLLRLFVMITFFGMACGDSHPLSPYAAAPLIEASFQTTPLIQHRDATDFSNVDGAVVTLYKSALHKNFLLTSSMIVANNTPIVDYFLPKIVQFEANADDIALLEVNVSAVYDALPSLKLLQTFKIIGQTDDTISFKWLYGLREVSLKSPWVASDFPSSIDDAVDSEEHVLPTIDSFVRSVHIVNNGLELEQISRIKKNWLSIDSDKILTKQGMDILEKDITIHVLSRLVPYVVNTSFQRKPSAFKQGIGYFEIANMVKDKGTLSTLATRFHVDNHADAVVYRISKAVPAELIEAVKEGVLYWNMVAGREIVRVETDVDNTLHTQGTKEVVLHWIESSNAGFAQGLLQPDPITGEILRADIYLVSAFDHLVRRNGDVVSASQQLTPSGFQSSMVCNYPLSMELIDESANLLKMRQDFMRSLVAHEVGHTLGLRHNFAGSFSSDLDSSEALNHAISDYVSDASHQGAATSSSVMDYLPLKDSVLLGAYIKNHALPYDSAAIQWGYGEVTTDDTYHFDIPFCTDVEAWHPAELVGCGIFDSGRNPVDGYIGMSHKRKRMAQDLLNHVVDQLALLDAPKPYQVRDMMHAFRPYVFAEHYIDGAKHLFGMMHRDAQALDVRLRFGARSAFNNQDYTNQSKQMIAGYIESAGGFSNIVHALYPTKGAQYAPSLGWLQRDMHMLMTHENFAQGTSVSGIDYQFSADVVQALQIYMPQLADTVEQHYMGYLLNIVSSSIFYAQPAYLPQLMYLRLTLAFYT